MHDLAVRLARSEVEAAQAERRAKNALRTTARQLDASCAARDIDTEDAYSGCAYPTDPTQCDVLRAATDIAYACRGMAWDFIASRIALAFHGKYLVCAMHVNDDMWHATVATGSSRSVVRFTSVGDRMRIHIVM
jgi:hypothetical protein